MCLYALVLGCASTAVRFPVGAEPVPVQEMFTIQHSGIAQPQHLVIRTAERWQTVWNLVNAPETATRQPPMVDFSRDMVLLVASGRRSTGGYSLAIAAVYRNGGQLVVVVHQIAPGRGCMTTQALTAPVTAVRVPRSPVPVAFIEQETMRHCQ